MIYGEDNGIDGIVLDVLLRKHERIRKDLGISVAVPPQSDQVLAALLEGILMRGGEHEQLTLDLGAMPQAQQLEHEWRSSAAQEKQSRSRFAQASIHPDEVQAALDAARSAMGEPDDVRDFVLGSLRELGAPVLDETAEAITIDLTQTPVGVREALRARGTRITFAADLPAPKGAAVLQRTDPAVSGLSRFVLEGALDPGLPDDQRPARRCGVIATNAVDRVTTAILLRVRTHVTLPGREETRTHIAEEARVIAFTGIPAAPTWLDPDEITRLLESKPDANVPPDAATNTMRAVLQALPTLQDDLDREARAVAEDLRQAHVTVRTAARGDRAGRLTIAGLTVEPDLPPDILGVYVFRPAGGTR